MPVSLDRGDLEFLEKRRWFAARWNLVATALFAGLVAFLAWMFWAHPRLVNPLHVFNELQDVSLPQSTLEIMVAMLPVIVSAIFVVLAIVIWFGSAVSRNERRYLRIIDRLRLEDKGGENGKCDSGTP